MVCLKLNSVISSNRHFSLLNRNKLLQLSTQLETTDRKYLPNQWDNTRQLPPSRRQFVMSTLALSNKTNNPSLSHLTELKRSNFFLFTLFQVEQLPADLGSCNRHTRSRDVFIYFPSSSGVPESQIRVHCGNGRTGGEERDFGGARA